MNIDEINQLFSAQTVCMFVIVEWIISSEGRDRTLLIKKLYEVQAEAFDSKNTGSAYAISHIIKLLEDAEEKDR